MYSSISQEEKRFLQVLERSLSPFEKFVAKADIEETLPLTSKRKKIFEKILPHFSSDSTYQIIPIQAITGIGKTYFLWQIKKSLNLKAFAIFLDVPDFDRLFFYNLYTKLIQELGVYTLRDITQQIADQWGANKKKYGIFQIDNPEEVLANAEESQLFKNSTHQNELKDIITIIIAHVMDPEKTNLAERWLLGEVMDPDELYFLGVEHNLSASFIAEELIKLLIKYLPNNLIIMFDDLDKNIFRYQLIEESEEDEEYYWSDSISLTQDNQINQFGSFDNKNNNKTLNSNNSVDKINENNNSTEKIQDHQKKQKNKFDTEETKQFISKLVNLIEFSKRVHIVFTYHPENKNLLDIFPSKVWGKIAPSFTLPPYTMDDAKEYFITALKNYRNKHNLKEIKENPYFPLSKKLIWVAYERAQGNPREVIRNFQKLFDAIVIDEMTISELEKSWADII